ncbi:uncharacterized protein LOC116095273 [Mastomys coucha]|uniref:uncharacterized protein LOC116095273 n=1 Tax=Mastomys coucha TaxID=35658 RepID=UPI001262A0A5|nr:uncharacterized protein LOC116095273 [Mastomys coucha]
MVAIKFSENNSYFSHHCEFLARGNLWQERFMLANSLRVQFIKAQKAQRQEEFKAWLQKLEAACSHSEFFCFLIVSSYTIEIEDDHVQLISKVIDVLQRCKLKLPGRGRRAACYLLTRGQEMVTQIKAHVASLEGIAPEDQVLFLAVSPLEDEATLGQCGVEALTTLEVACRMLGGKVHGSLARAGKVRGQTPKVAKQKKNTGRAKRQMQYNRRFVNAVPTFGKKKGPSANS